MTRRFISVFFKIILFLRATEISNEIFVHGTIKFGVKIYKSDAYNSFEKCPNMSSHLFDHIFQKKVKLSGVLSLTVLFKWSHNNKSVGVKSGDLADRPIRSYLQIRSFRELETFLLVDW